MLRSTRRRSRIGPRPAPPGGQQEMQEENPWQRSVSHWNASVDALKPQARRQLTSLFRRPFELKDAGRISHVRPLGRQAGWRSRRSTCQRPKGWGGCWIDRQVEMHGSASRCAPARDARDRVRSRSCCRLDPRIANRRAGRLASTGHRLRDSRQHEDVSGDTPHGLETGFEEAAQRVEGGIELTYRKQILPPGSGAARSATSPARDR